MAWVALCAGTLAWLGVSLRENAGPWALDLLIPSEIEERHRQGLTAGWPESSFHPASLSADERLLAFSRLNGAIELWDLQEKQGRTVLEGVTGTDRAARLARMKREVPIVHLLPDNRTILANLGLSSTWMFIGLDGGSRTLDPEGRHVSQGILSPDGRQCVFESLHSIIAMDLASGAARTWASSQTPSIQMTFAPTGDRFACTEGERVLLRDIAPDAGEFLWEDRLNPLISRPGAPLSAPEDYVRPSGAGRYTSYVSIEELTFSDDGRYLAVRYWVNDDPVSSDLIERLRLYEADSGHLIWDRDTWPGLSDIQFSADAARLLLLGYNDGMYAEICDTVTGTREGRYAVKQSYMPSPTCLWMPDERWIAAYHQRIELIDTTGEHTSLLLPGSDHIAQVIVTDDGKGLIEVSGGRTVRVWRQRRASSALGAFACPQAWAVFLVGLLTPLGVLMIPGRRIYRITPPRAVWRAGVVAALLCGFFLAEGVANRAVAELWSDGFISLPFPMQMVIFVAMVFGPLAIMLRPKDWRSSSFAILDLLAGVAAMRLAYVAARIASVEIGRMPDNLLGVSYRAPTGWILAGLYAALVVAAVATHVCLARTPAEDEPATDSAAEDEGDPDSTIPEVVL